MRIVELFGILGKTNPQVEAANFISKNTQGNLKYFKMHNDDDEIFIGSEDRSRATRQV